MRLSVMGCFALLVATCLTAQAQTLDRVRDSGTFTIGYRVDAPPFSFKNDIGEPSGYMVDICRQVASEVRRSTKLPSFTVKYVPVSAEDRFDKIREGKVDILCGPTTVTLSRRALVDFSLFTFIDGASVLYAADGPDNFEALAGQKVAVRAGTTTEKTLKALLTQLNIEAQVVALSDHRSGLRAVEAGVVAAYFADRSILVYLSQTAAASDGLRVSDRFFTVEPYGLGLTLGDTEFRLMVDRTLSRLYRSGEIENLFHSAFGADAYPSAMLSSLYQAAGLAD
jgi:ABC-type amino acid transport substrate-binding protein